MKKSTLTPHNNLQRISDLLVESVHLVKSPANKKKFFLMKGEKMEKNIEKLKLALKEQGLSGDEIALVVSNSKMVEILSDEKNTKTAIDVLKDVMRDTIMNIENTLQSATNIKDLTEQIIAPFESLNTFIAGSVDEKGEGKSDTDDTESIDANSVTELADAVLGLARDVTDLIIEENEVMETENNSEEN